MIDIAVIQQALGQEGVDGWLFFDHHERDPLAYRVLKLTPGRTVTRRWYYFIPTQGEPVGLVHRIEAGMLDQLPGEKVVYSRWSTQIDGLRQLLGKSKRIAMQYSPNCAIPYVSMVDGGTLELVRANGVEIVSSANLIQQFEARWSAEQLEMHLEAGRLVDAIRAAAFRHIGDSVRSGSVVTEWDVNRFIRNAFEHAGLITDHGPIVAVNANMSNPHYEPEAARSLAIKKNDAVLIDMWAKLNRSGGVYYDITWTGFCGSDPPSELSNIFHVVCDARDRAVVRVRSAVAAKQPLRG